MVEKAVEIGSADAAGEAILVTTAETIERS